MNKIELKYGYCNSGTVHNAPWWCISLPPHSSTVWSQTWFAVWIDYCMLSGFLKALYVLTPSKKHADRWAFCACVHGILQTIGTLSTFYSYSSLRIQCNDLCTCDSYMLECSDLMKFRQLASSEFWVMTVTFPRSHLLIHFTMRTQNMNLHQHTQPRSVLTRV